MADMSEFFWWVESLARSLEWEDRRRFAHAWEVTGGSRRQERLELQRQKTQEIGDEHEDAVNTEAGGIADLVNEEGAVPHEHGGASKLYSENGERCNWKGDPALGEECAWNYNKPCPGCKATGFEGGEEKPGGVNPCTQCGGGGAIPDETLSTPPHRHPEPAKPYVDQAKPVHDFGDGWTVKKAHTFGDLKYEGLMMTNCIQDDAGGGECSNCEGRRYCPECEHEGQNDCGECGGDYERECDSCYGAGHHDCESCGTSVQETCGSCDGKGDIDGSTCPTCSGGGKQPVWYDGKKDCSACDGEGVDGDGDECWNCDGSKVEDCDECGGEGKFECGHCDGKGSFTCEHCDEGKTECWECEGSDICQTCDGQGGTGAKGGPENYYRPYTDDEADEFQRAPGGAYSLRDKDNIPHVSFLHGDEGNTDPRHINNVLGRENSVPKPEYQNKMLKYMQSKIDQSGKPPGTEEKCPECKGAKTFEQTRRVHCTGCGGDDSHIGSGLFTRDEGTSNETVEVHEDCQGRGYNHEKYQAPCYDCKGTGEPTAMVGWGYGTDRKQYTTHDIDHILAGNVPKPKVMLIAHHTRNVNHVETLPNAQKAREFMDRTSDLRIKGGCGSCGGTGDEGESGACRTCLGTGDSVQKVMNKEAFTLHAVPLDRVGESRVEYEPSSEAWKVKDGKGAKVDWDGGTQLDWKQLVNPGPDSPYVINTNPTHEEHRRMRQGQPDYVNQVVPRVAALCTTHDDFLEEYVPLKCGSKKASPCHFRYIDLDAAGKMVHEVTHGH